MEANIAIYLATFANEGPLAKTLESMVPEIARYGEPVELWIVDNACREETEALVKSVSHPMIDARYHAAKRKGKARAMNEVLHGSEAEYMVFTDDDVVFDPGWLKNILLPLLSGSVDAVQGHVELADHLKRPWMTPIIRSFMAETTHHMDRRTDLVGANMAMHRKVTFAVRGFDPELGPGAMGFAEDTLYSYQLGRAGYRMTYNPSCIVRHHFKPERLRAKEMVSRAAGQGRCHAYVGYHWRHGQIDRKTCNRALDLTREVAEKAFAQAPDEEMPIPDEILLTVQNFAEYTLLLESLDLPRNYAREGLAKLVGELPEHVLEVPAV